MVLGNKCDMNDRRQVSKERGEQLAIEYGIKFMETSAKVRVTKRVFVLFRLQRVLKCVHATVTGWGSTHSTSFAYVYSPT